MGEIIKNKTDLEIFTNLLKSWGVEYTLSTWGMPIVHEVSFHINDDSNPPIKIIGDSWASCDFVFDKDGEFDYIEISGD